MGLITPCILAWQVPRIDGGPLAVTCAHGTHFIRKPLRNSNFHSESNQPAKLSSSPRAKKLAMLELLELPRGFSEILLSFVCFRVVYFLLSNFGSLPSSLACNRHLHGKYGSTGISGFHSFIRALQPSCQFTGRILCPLSLCSLIRSASLASR